MAGLKANVGKGRRMTLGKNLIAWLGDSTGGASKHHLEVVGFDINIAAACLAESSGLRSSEEAGTSFGACTEVLVVAVDTAGVSCRRRYMVSKSKSESIFHLRNSSAPGASQPTHPRSLTTRE